MIDGPTFEATADQVFFADSPLHVGWEVPDFFHHLPVQAADPDELGGEIAELAAALFAERSNEEQFDAAMVFLAQTADLIDAGAQYAGVCFVDFDGRPSMATLVAQRVERDAGGLRATADAIAGQLSRHAPQDDVRVVEMAYGPVALRTGLTSTAIPPEISPDSLPHEVPRRFVQAHIPLPDDLSVQMLELSTVSVDDWDAYSRMFGEILKTVEWATDDELRTAREQRTAASAASEPGDEARHGLVAVSSRVWDLIKTEQPRVGMSPELDRMRLAFCPTCRVSGNEAPCTPEHLWTLAPVEAAEADSLTAHLEDRLTAEGWTWSPGLPSNPGRWYADRTAPEPARLALRHSPGSTALHVTVTLTCRHQPATAPGPRR
ncbi:hypothetical protein ACH4E8_11430 [Streptomyces sp. NPDC017979]|uniref:hypothetical protein n=1 Tax=Streptomyces sp. NPDC017979 TaxID=3365024 RepID=UPI00378BA6F5